MKSIKDYKEELGLPDGDEIREFYGFHYRASDGCIGLEDNITKKTQMSFEAHSLQAVLDNFHTFLTTVGFGYVGDITIESKDGEKCWGTNGSHK